MLFYPFYDKLFSSFLCKENPILFTYHSFYVYFSLFLHKTLPILASNFRSFRATKGMQIAKKVEK